MSEQHPLAGGFFFDKPRDGAPDFIRGRISIKVEDALKTLAKYKNDAGYVNLELCRSKDGTKMYLQVNTYGLDTAEPIDRPEKPNEDWREDSTEVEPDEIPF